MNLLITGGAGFMGSNFIRYILANYPDYKIINLDKLTYAGNPENLRDAEISPNYGFVKGDICDEGIVDFLFSRKPDAVINFAAETHVDRSISGPKDFIHTDVLGTHNLLEHTKKHNIPLHIQISTDEVYGAIDDGSFTEESPFNPSSPYSASKAGGDHLVMAYKKTFGVPVIRVHSCNVFGPYQYPEKFIPLFVTNLLEDKKVPVYGDGKQTREWIYVLDFCRALDFLLHYGRTGEVYNIGAGFEMKNIDTTFLILDYLGKGENYIEYVKDRPGHDVRYSLDCSKLRQLGWQPVYTFKESLHDTIEWYIKNKEWWKKLKSGEYLEYYRKQYQNY